jgi:arylsulfatase A-like enzyme
LTASGRDGHPAPIQQLRSTGCCSWKASPIGTRVSALVRSVDIAPSLLSLTDVPVSETFRGTAALAGEFSPFACSRADFAVRHATAERSLVSHGFKLIETDDRTLLFNLGDDPDERRSLTAEMPEQAEQMSKFVAALKGAVDDGGTDVRTPKDG